MKPADSSQTTAEGTRTTLVFAAAASMVWLGLAFALGWFAAPCEDGTTFGCLEANEWGDFLAGVFAPVAFFWLVATVWIQSNELREQRRELALTRQEFADNRAVAEAQAKEAHRQAEFIGAQTKVIQQKERDEQLVTKLVLLRSWVIASFASKSAYNSLGHRISEDRGYVTGGSPDDPKEFFIHFQTRLNAAVMDGLRDRKGKWLKLTAVENSDFKLKNLQSLLTDILKARDDVGPALQTLLDNTGAATTLTALGLLLANDEDSLSESPLDLSEQHGDSR